MKNIISNMLEHPIATLLIIGTAFSGLAKVVGAARGGRIEPSVKVDVIKSKPEG
jgi:hypothetical protein